MADYEFGEFAAAIRAAMLTANETLAEEQIRRLEQYLERTCEAEPSGDVAACEPASEHGLLHDRSAIEFGSSQFYAVTELSVELDCVIEESRGKGKAGRRAMSMRSWHPEKQVGVDKVRITYSGRDGIEGAVYINDELFKVLG